MVDNISWKNEKKKRSMNGLLENFAVCLLMTIKPQKIYLTKKHSVLKYGKKLTGVLDDWFYGMSKRVGLFNAEVSYIFFNQLQITNN